MKPFIPIGQICSVDPYEQNEDWEFHGTFEGRMDLWAHGYRGRPSQVHVRWMGTDGSVRTEGFSFDGVDDPPPLIESIFGHAHLGPQIVRAMIEAIRRIKNPDPSISPASKK